MSVQNEAPICQSCEMPMNEPKEFGKNADGSKNDDYCCYCWKKGKFTEPKKKFEDAVEFNIQFVMKDGAAETEDEAREMLKESMSKLKRWATA
ncbi:MAG: zinc ribbon domain-containing protein [Defluviitaleaceae bacterium]|nr:zinc ribbon domain-containing protein [Defluviitaleaceae bacterium]